MSTTPFADGAPQLAEQGLPVFRIAPNEKQKPIEKWGTGNARQRATTDPAEIARRARLTPNANIGVATGVLADGTYFAVLDIDTKYDAVRPDWAITTREVNTPSGGAHLYYLTDGPVKNSKARIGPGLDVRGIGGMVVAPPSRTTTGTYSWSTTPDEPMAFVPAWRFHDYACDASGGRGISHTSRLVKPSEVRRGDVHDQCLAWAAWFANQGYDDDEVRERVWEFVGKITIPVDNANGHIDSAIEWVLRKHHDQEEALALTIPGGNP